MATLVLTAVGTLVGGPIGGALGALVGQQVDRAVFSPNTTIREPRLKDLDVQTSNYGRTIPAIFGRMRVSGAVIWSTRIQRRTKKSGGGKGKPKVVSHKYSVSFAVALSSRPAIRVERIWADGKLIRKAGQSGLSTGGKLRFHSGDGAQQPDPLITAAKGAGRTPAYRDLAYCVFEGMQLADYGNRLPSLTFELVADEGDVDAEAICRFFAPDGISVAGGGPLIGYAANSGDLATIVADFQPIEGFVVRESEQGILLSSAQEAEETMLEGDAVALLDGKAVEAPILERGGEDGGRETVELRYYDVDRDYQIGVQASEVVTGERGLYRSDLPASLNASRARTIAQALAEHRRNAGHHLTLAIAEEMAPSLQPGDLLGFPAHPGLWRLEETEYTPGLIHLSCRSWLPAHGISAGGAESEFSGSELPDFGVTRFWALDLSAVPLFAADAAALSLIAAGTGTGWGGASIAIEQQGVQYPIADVEAGLVAGELVQPLTPSATMLEDIGSMISVRVLNEDMAFESADDAALALGENLIHLNGEILQFATAEQVGVLDWRLSKLRRGLFGSEAASASTHSVGAPLILLEADMPRLVYDVSPLEQGTSLRFTAEALHDEEPVEDEAIVGKRGLAPFAPVHGIWRREGDSVYLSWIRRPRHYVAWQDEVDMPLAESRELYRIGLPGQAEPIAESAVTEAQMALNELRQLLGAAAELLIEVRQVGDFALSPAASISIPAAALA